MTQNDLPNEHRIHQMTSSARTRKGRAAFGYELRADGEEVPQLWYRFFWAVFVPLFILSVAGGIVVLMVLNPEENQKREREVPIPLVQTIEVTPEPLAVWIETQGSVQPRTRTTVIAQVSGMVTEVAPNYVVGGLFEAEDVLLQIDPRDQEALLARDRATLAEAELALAEEQARGEQAVRDWQRIGGPSPSALTLREPQLARARARVDSARASVIKAELDLERSEIQLPFAGMVESRSADLGQFIRPGAVLATVFAVDYAEVRLPITSRDLAFLELEDLGNGLPVVLEAEYAGEVRQWEARLVRTEGVLDQRSRLIYAVARVEDPYNRLNDPSRSPLPMGTFVSARIAGRTLPKAVPLPRHLIVEGNQVFVVDEENRLRARPIEIARRARDQVYVSAGLSMGERVNATVLDYMADGMEVKTVESLAKPDPEEELAPEAGSVAESPADQDGGGKAS